LEVSLTENIQRKSLDAIEEARAFKAYVNDFGWGGLTDLASKISKSNTYVCRRLALLELPTELLEKVRKHEISPSTAEELIPVKNSQEQNRIADLIVAKSSSSREARKLVESSKNLSTRMDQIQDLDDTLYPQSDILDIEFNVQRSFDKSITAIKIAMSKIASILESVEENWIVYEILMQHKNMLNAQIDLLIREKKKLSR
jgi:ParB family chromosome partitioning protein